jgi:hypothetical protein
VVTKAKDAGVNEKDIWLALPRAAGRDAAQLRVAPGAGEWALYPWGTLDRWGIHQVTVNPTWLAGKIPELNRDLYRCEHHL